LYLRSGEDGIRASGFEVIARLAHICGMEMFVLELEKREVRKGVFGAVAEGNSCRVEGQRVGRDGSFGGLWSE
jgi:hypothetical protein